MSLILDFKREQLVQGEPDFSQLANENRAAASFGGLNLTTIMSEDDEEEEYEYEDEYEEEEEGELEEGGEEGGEEGEGECG